MNKLYILLTIIALSIAGSLGFTYFTSQKHPGAPVFRIAIFTPVTHAALEEIENDFKASMRKDRADKFEFTTYNANGNKTLQRAQADEIIAGNYDLIFSIATSCTQLIAEIAKKKGTTVPQVFCSVEDPLGMGIIKSLESSGNNITGVIEGAPDLAQQIQIMRTLKPDTKNVVLVYDPSVKFTIEKTKQELEQLLKQFNINLQSIEISHANEIQQKVAGLLKDKDFVLIFKDNTVVSGIDSLITLCNRYGVPLFASDLNSGKKGAAVAYGIREGDSGVDAAQKALQILIDHKKPSDIPITPVEKLTLAINKEALASQKLSIDPALLSKIEQTGSL